MCLIPVVNETSCFVVISWLRQLEYEAYLIAGIYVTGGFSARFSGSLLQCPADMIFTVPHSRAKVAQFKIRKMQISLWKKVYIQYKLKFPSWARTKSAKQGRSTWCIRRSDSRNSEPLRLFPRRYLTISLRLSPVLCGFPTILTGIWNKLIATPLCLE